LNGCCHFPSVSASDRPPSTVCLNNMHALH